MTVLVGILIILTFLPGISPSLSSPITLADSNISNTTNNSTDYVLVVLPYYMQNLQPGEETYVYFYAYEHVDAVIDLNHNGVEDPDEPRINVSYPGQYIHLSISTGDSYKYPYYYLNDYYESLWILVKPPVAISVLIYNSNEFSFVASYNPPPPGRVIPVPPLKGNVYISPADPMGANITVIGGPYDGRMYHLNSSDYLVLNNNGTAFTLSSDRPIAAVIVNEDNTSHSTFAVELIPGEEKYFTKGSLPYPERYIDSNYTVASNVSVYYMIYREGEEWSYGEYYYPSSILGLSSGEKGIGYVIIEAYNESGGTSLSAVAVYNITKHPMYNGTRAFITQSSLATPYSSYDRLVWYFFVPSGIRGELYIGYDTIRDNIFDYYGKIEVFGDELALIAGDGDKFEAVSYPDYIAIGYQLWGLGDLSYMMARYVMIPVPVDITVPLNLTQPYNAHIYEYFFGTNDSYIPNYILVSQNFNFHYPPPQGGFGYEMSLKYSLEIEPWGEGSCSDFSLILIVMDEFFHPVEVNVSRGSCNLSFEGNISFTHVPRTIYLWSFVYDAGFLDQNADILSNYEYGISSGEPGRLPKYEPNYIEEGVYSPPSNMSYSVGISGYYLHIKQIALPEDYTTTLEQLLGVVIRPAGGGAPPTTTTTTTSPGTQTTTSTSPHTTTHYQTVPTTSEGGGTQGTTSTPQHATTTLPLGLTEGEVFKYNVKISASGQNGTLNTNGVVSIVLKGSENGFKLQLSNTDLNETAKGLMSVGSSISDLFYLVFLGPAASSHYSSDAESLQGFYCPIVNPEAGSKTINGTESLGGLEIKYKCSYSNGILSYVKLDAVASYQGQKTGEIHIEASAQGLPSQTATAGKGGEGEGVLGSKLLYYAIAIVIVIIVILVILIKKRK